MIRLALISLTALLIAVPAAASMLPGFHVEKVAATDGFLTAIAFAPDGTLHYSVTTGEIYRLEGERSVRVAKVNTAATGNAVQLGIAFRGDQIISHYVLPDFSADVIASVDPLDGKVTVIANLPCDLGTNCSTEHHGGNPVVGPDGSIWVGIGDYGIGVVAQDDESPGGKIHRILPDGTATIFAKGFRNPYDLVIHPDGDRLLVGDNGPEAEDEITIVRAGEHHGWPRTWGNRPPPRGDGSAGLGLRGDRRPDRDDARARFRESAWDGTSRRGIRDEGSLLLSRHRRDRRAGHHLRRPG